MKSITTQVSHLGHHISHTLSSIPRPHIGTQRIKDALRTHQSRLSRAAGRVVRACRTDENLGPPAPAAVAASKKSVTFGAGNTAQPPQPQHISSPSSEEDWAEATERHLDFRGIAEFTSELTLEQLCKIQESINPLLKEVNTHASAAINGKSGTPRWTFAVEKVIAATDQLSEVIGQFGNDYLQAGGRDQKLAQWLDTKLTDIHAETQAWQARLGFAA